MSEWFEAEEHQDYARPSTTIDQSSSSRKRKFVEGPEGPGASFEIQPCPQSQHGVPVTVLPLSLIPRSCLNLSSLDHGHRISGGLDTRFFSTYIEALEDEHINPSTSPKVLVARFLPEDRLYAIERARAGTYAFCRLVSWFDEDALRRQACNPSTQLTRPTQPVSNANQEWWLSAKLPKAETHEQIHVERPKTTSRIKDFAHVADAPLSTVTKGINDDVSTSQPGPTAGASTTLASITPAQDTSFSLVEHYLDTLYMSTASLAYFVKGPLSRARATRVESKSLPSLAEVLRVLVLTVQQMDKRYSESVPTIIRRVDAGSGDDNAGSKKKIRRKATKRGKDCLLPDEDEVVSRWWTSDEVAILASADLGTMLRSRLPALRFRETLLQLVLILEILAVEKLSANTAPHVPMAGSFSAEGGSVGTVREDEKNKKAKKPKDLTMLIETLVDRLTIWQSIEATADKPESKGPQAQDRNALGSLITDDNSDKLKDFCTDIVIPFYHNRLPDLVDKLSEKMGLPPISPLRRKPAPKEAAPKLAPGSVISRTGPTISDRRKPFSRVASDTSMKAPAPPSLLRSATDSSLLKRERSSTPRSPFLETALSRPQSRHRDIGEANESQEKGRRSLSRASSMTLAGKSFNQREVDMSAMTRYHETKAKKKVNVEDELKTAIATLKRPNRGLAVKEIRDDAEARLSRQHKPALVPQRRGFVGVQVNATPKRSQKSRDALRGFHDEAGSVGRSVDVENIPSSMAPIPASVIRPSATTDVPRSESSHHISSTPSQKMAQKPNPPSSSRQQLPISYSQAAAVHPFSTPVKSSRTLFEQQVSSTPSFAVPSTPASLGAPSYNIAGTPLKPSRINENTMLSATHKLPEKAHEQPPPSIYDKLGWDDEDELM